MDTKLLEIFLMHRGYTFALDNFYTSTRTLEIKECVCAANHIEQVLKFPRHSGEPDFLSRTIGRDFEMM